MDLAFVLNKAEAWTHSLHQIVDAIPPDRSPAASGRPIRCERADNQSATRAELVLQLLAITLALPFMHQKMKDCPVMPEIKGLGRQSMREQISLPPVHPLQQGAALLVSKQSCACQ